jgi:hypothetical protein
MTRLKIEEHLSAVLAPLVRSAITEAIGDVISADTVWPVLDDALLESYRESTPFLAFWDGTPSIGVNMHGSNLDCEGAVVIYGMSEEYRRAGCLDDEAKMEVQQIVKGMTDLIEKLVAERDELLALAA